MPLFKCEECGMLENTALCNYWYNKAYKKPGLCSVCEGSWHGQFSRKTPEELGYVKGKDGFYYSPEEMGIKGLNK